LSAYGIQFVMKQRLVHKLEKAGAVSEEKAVTFEEAKLNEQEQYWLSYFAGVFLGKIKKTKNNHYYIGSQYSPVD
jgi:NurA-like 5'-3' nuclease